MKPSMVPPAAERPMIWKCSNATKLGLAPGSIRGWFCRVAVSKNARDTSGAIVGQITDEVTQRGIWRHWKKVMSQRGGETLPLVWTETVLAIEQSGLAVEIVKAVPLPLTRRR